MKGTREKYYGVIKPDRIPWFFLYLVLVYETKLRK